MTILNSPCEQMSKDTHTDPQPGRVKEIQSTKATNNLAETKTEMLEARPALKEANFVEANDKAAAARIEKSEKKIVPDRPSMKKVDLAKPMAAKLDLEKSNEDNVLEKAVEEEKAKRQKRQKEQKAKRKRDRKERKTPKGALSLLIQYDSDSASSAGGLGTESDTSSNRSSPLSPLSAGAADSTQLCDNEATAIRNISGQRNSQNPSFLTNGSLSPRSRCPSKSTSPKDLAKKRFSVSTTPEDHKKAKLNGSSLAVSSFDSTVRPFVNLNDTLHSVQKLPPQTASAVPMVTSTVANYNQGTIQPPFPGNTSYPPHIAVPGRQATPNCMPYPTTNLGYGHTTGPYTANIPPGYYQPPGQGITTPSGYFPWRGNYPPLPNSYSCSYPGNPGGPGNGYR